MKLTEEQKAEVYNYIFPVPRYRETFNEVYDHVINALEDSEETFSENLIDHIVNNDFAGYFQILEDEKIQQKKLMKKYAGLFWQEMLNTFKWPGAINNMILIGFCSIFFYYGSENFNIKPTVMACSIIISSVSIFGIIKSYMNKRKFLKDSIIDSFWRFESLFGLSILNLFLNGFLNKENPFGLSDEARLIAALVMFIFSSIYVRAYIKFYNQKIKVLTI